MQASHHQIKQLVGVISAKGGVGKSFTTGLLACGLARQGFRAGILDANFTGASIPLLFGLSGPARVGSYSFMPLQSRSGIGVIAPNLLFEDQDQVVFWKDSMAGKVIEELWKEVEWGALDFLLVDMPPVPSELGMSIMQSLPFNGFVLVTTPQNLTTKIALDAVAAAHKAGVPVLGVVENMSYYLNPQTGEKANLFGPGTVETAAKVAQAPVLAQIPFDPEIVQLCDLGNIEGVKLDQTQKLTEAFLEAVSVAEKKAALSSAAQGATAASPAPALAQPARHGFSDTVIELIRSKENMGVLDNPDAQGFFLGRCGDRMQIDLRIVSGRIKDARFIADGCGATQACGSMITRMAGAKTLDQAEKITPDDLLTALGGLPDDHLHCAELAVMALREALVDAREGHGTMRQH